MKIFLTLFLYNNTQEKKQLQETNRSMRGFLMYAKMLISPVMT